MPYPTLSPLPGPAILSNRSDWSPADLGSALKLWLSAEDAQADGAGLLTLWPDRSAHGNHAIPNAGHEPLRAVGAFAGLGVGVGGSNLWCDLPNIGMSEQFSAFWVMDMAPDPTPGSAARYLFIDGFDLNGGRRPMLNGRTSDTLSVLHGAGEKGVIDLPTTPHILSAIRSDTGLTGYQNGAEIFDAPGALPGAGLSGDTGLIGAENGVAHWAEIVLVEGALDMATRQRIEGWLAHRWALAADLPATHPHSA